MQEELVFQPGGMRFSSNFGENDQCSKCGAATVEQRTFGTLSRDNVFTPTYTTYSCVECGKARDFILYVAVVPKVEKKIKE